MRAIAYLRVSTEEQKLHGYSPAAQRAAVARYADANGITVVDVIEDLDVSAGKPLTSRPGGARLFAALAQPRKTRPADAVIITACDRMFRNVVEGLQFLDWATPRGLRLLSLREVIDTATAAGRFQATVTLATGEFERNVIAERTAQAMQQMRREGKFTGTAPFGTVRADAQGRRQPDGEYLARDPATWPTRERVVGLYRNGLADGRRVGYGKLANHLRFDLRLPSPAGCGWWSKATLKSLHDTHDRLSELPLAEEVATPTAV